jgi:hypothetical protein
MVKLINRGWHLFYKSLSLELFLTIGTVVFFCLTMHSLYLNVFTSVDKGVLDNKLCSPVYLKSVLDPVARAKLASQCAVQLEKHKSMGKFWPLAKTAL